MFMKVLISLTFCCFLSCRVFAFEAQCASLLLKNLTDETQSAIVVTIIKKAQILLDDAMKYASIPTRSLGAEMTLNNPMECTEGISSKTVEKKTSSTEGLFEKPMDCFEILKNNRSARSGVYKIWPYNRVITTYPIYVYCDMEDDGGAWTVIQRRGDFGSGEDYFYKDWRYYKNGFGDVKKDFWLGNDVIFAITNLKANVVKFELTDWEGKTTYAAYDEFWIENELRNYTLHVSGYSGTAGDSFHYHDGEAFTTQDRDNDKFSTNCAVKYKGAWWYKDCHYSSLNGFYVNGGHTTNEIGIKWKDFKGYTYSLKETVIKIRPRNFRSF